MIPLLRSLLLPLVSNRISNAFIENFQWICGISKDGKPTNPIFHFYFRLSSSLGEEVFSLMPLIYWCLFPLSMTFITNFGITLTAGQLIKDVLMLPRPPAKGENWSIAKLERHFETEYGFPSTHTMSGYLPLTLVWAMEKQGYLDVNTPRSDYYRNFSYIWLASIAISRLYMGVHSPVDIIGGLGIAYLVSLILFEYSEGLNEILYVKPFGILIQIASLLWFLFLYPKARPWTASFGTAAQIYGTWIGCASALWFVHNVGEGRLMSSLQANSSSMAVALTSSDNFFFLSLINDNNRLLFLRSVLGLTLAAMAKVASKRLLLSVARLAHRYGWPSLLTSHMAELKDSQGRDVPLEKLYHVEVPVRLLNYSAVAWAVIVLTPIAWSLLLPGI